MCSKKEIRKQKFFSKAQCVSRERFLGKSGFAGFPKNKLVSLYQETRDRTLIYVDGFEDLINPKLSSEGTIGTLKDIMCATSEDYHSTIIFSTKDPSKLDRIATQSNRISEKINVNLDI